MILSLKLQFCLKMHFYQHYEIFTFGLFKSLALELSFANLETKMWHDFLIFSVNRKWAFSIFPIIVAATFLV